MDPEFIWGTVVPAYLGALGTIAASTIAAIALIRDTRTRKGLNEIAQVANEVTEATADQTRESIAYAAREPARESGLHLMTHGDQTVLRNMTSGRITISSMDVPSGGKTLTMRVALPAEVEAGEGLGFIVHDLLGGPAIAALEVSWVNERGVPQRSRYFV